MGAEALRRLKPHEVRALTLKAQGLSYQEICDATGWTYTKVNRCLSEGRRRFLDRVAGIEAGEECERLAPLLSALADGELGSEDLAALRGHMTGCLSCRAPCASTATPRHVRPPCCPRQPPRRSGERCATACTRGRTPQLTGARARAGRRRALAPGSRANRDSQARCGRGIVGRAGERRCCAVHSAGARRPPTQVTEPTGSLPAQQSPGGILNRRRRR